MDIGNPVSAYFLLNGDAQEEIPGRANTKCLSFGHLFIGEIYDRCPECFSSDIEEMIDENDGGYW